MENRPLDHNPTTPVLQHDPWHSRSSCPMAATRLFLFILLSMILFLSPPAAWSQLGGSLIIAGNGPEQATIEALAKAFEKANPRTYVDVLWEETSSPLQSVKTGLAHIAVTGVKDPMLRAIQIGWEGIGILVHLSNSTKQVTSRQVADIFSGKITEWSEVGGPETRIFVINRPIGQDIREAFESHLGIVGSIPQAAPLIATDDMVVQTVVGTVPPRSAAAYVSLRTGISAVSQGVAVRLLQVDQVEPEPLTVEDGRYRLRRPLLLLSTTDSNALVHAFADFALSAVGQAIVGELYVPISSK